MISETSLGLSRMDCFSTFDLASVYWQVGMVEEAFQKLAFVC